MKNIILKTLAYICAISQFLGACAIDSDSIIPVLMIMIPLIYMIPFCYVNKFFDMEDED